MIIWVSLRRMLYRSLPVGKNICFVQAEQAAEASIMDYLTENYEIERELNRGKFIFEYDRRISYPIGCHFYLDGKICEVIQAINGYKAPLSYTLLARNRRDT